MKKLILLFVLLGVCAEAACAQTTTITASDLKMAGAPITTGTVTLTPVNLAGIPIAFADGTGAQNGPTAFACQLTTGAIVGAIQPNGTVSGTCTVPDATETVPANVLYSIQVCDKSTGLSTSGKCYTLQGVTGVSGSSWALDHYGPPAQTTNVATLQAAQGPTTPASCVPPSVFTNTATHVFYTCIGGSFVPVSAAAAGAYLSQIGCSVQTVDLATGAVYGGWTSPTDPTSCINTWLANNTTAGKTTTLHVDVPFASSGIYGPATGGWALVSDIVPGMQVVTITGYSITGNVVTFTTKPQNLVAGQGIIINGFPASTFLNGAMFSAGGYGGLPLLVLSSGLSSTQFSASSPAFTHANVGSTTEAGEGMIPTGNGLYQIAGSPGHLIGNGPQTNTNICPGGYMDPGYNQAYSALPALAGGVTIKNLFLNGNNVNVIPSTGSFSLGGAYCTNTGIAIQNASGNDVSGNYLYNYSGYAVFFRNTAYDTFRSNSIMPFGPNIPVYEGNLDGIHIDAPASNVLLDGNVIGSGDDAFALNAPEGWPGLIDHVDVANTIYRGALSAGRMYTNSTAAPSGYPQPHISAVNVHGGTGNIGIVFFPIGNEGTTSKTVLNTMDNIHIDNNHLVLTPYAGSSSLAGSGVVLSENISDITFANDSFDGITNGTTAGIINTTASPTINQLTIENVSTTRTSSSTQPNSIFNTTGGYYSAPGTAHIGQLNLGGVNQIIDSVGGPYSTVANALYLADSTVGKLTGLNSINMSNITNYVDTFSTTSSTTAFSTPTPVGSGTFDCARLGAGTGATCSISGTEASGIVTVTTGTSPAASSLIFAYVPARTRLAAPACIVTTNSSGAAPLSPIGSASGTVYFGAVSGSTPLTAGTTYVFNYQCPW